MARLQHVVKLGSLREGFKSLSANVKNDIQYNHIGMFEKANNVNIMSLIDTYDFKRIVNTAINKSISINEVFNEYVTSVSSIEQILNSVQTTGLDTRQFMIAAKFRFGGTFYELNNPNDIERLKSKLQISKRISESVGCLLKPRTGYTVPKNSDYASEEVRQFVCKPVMNEIIVASILHTNSNVIKQWRNINTNKSVHVFGPRVTANGEFIPYIYEYNLMTSKVNNLKKSYDSIIVADVNKYFKSININHLTTLFTDIFNSFKQSQFLTSQLKFKYINESGVVCDSDNGLTIESNYQHFLASIFMESVLSKFINNHTTLYTEVKDIQIVAYIDDIFIFVKHHESTSLDNVKLLNKRIYNDFSVYLESMFQLSLNESKAQIIDNHTRNLDQKIIGIKGLVRLPTFNYIELLNNSVDTNNDDVFSYSNITISTDEWLSVLKEIVNVFEKSYLSRYSLRDLSDTAKRVVYPLFMKPGSDNSIYPFLHVDTIKSTFIESYIVERLNELQFKEKCNISKLLGITSPTYNTVNLFNQNNRHGYESYHDYLSESLPRLNRFMRADNIAFYISNYEKFEFHNSLVYNLGNLEDWSTNGIVIIHPNNEKHLLKSEANILDVLQYLFLCRTQTGQDINQVINTCMKLITMFPNKSRFIAGIIKKHLKRVDKLDIDVSSTFVNMNMTACLINSDISHKKFDYFKYCLRQMKL